MLLFYLIFLFGHLVHCNLFGANREDLPEGSLPRPLPFFSGRVGEFTKAKEVHGGRITGQRTTAIVLAPDSPTRQLCEMLGDTIHVMPGPWKEEAGPHNSSVIEVLNQMAPGARILALDYTRSRECLETPGVTEAFAVNFSYVYTSQDFIDKYDRDFDKWNKVNCWHLALIRCLCQKSKIFCQSIGNDSMNFESTVRFENPGAELTLEDLMCSYLQDPVVKRCLIFVGSLDPDFRISGFSNHPGPFEEIQAITIFTLGRHVRTLEGPRSGTSFATPIVCGAALLLHQAYPTLDAEAVKEVLLGSADRSFFLERTYLPGKNSGYGVFICDEEGGDAAPKNIAVAKFNPSLYGRGVLNLNAAFIYARLKIENPHWDSVRLRREMKDVMARQRDKAAITIQKNLRGRIVRKRIAQKDKAAITIQKNLRGWIVRKRIAQKDKAAITIQKNLRGWNVRKRIAKKNLKTDKPS